jgi:PmbA protein
MHKEQLENIVSELLAEARRQGVDHAEAGVNVQQGLGVTARLGEVETIEHTNDHSLGLTVYRGKRKGSASTTDLSPQAIKETVAAACRIAKYTSEDPAAGLADAERMATDMTDLDLHHPWEIDADQALTLACECEQAARHYDPRISNSEGASVHTQNSLFVYSNTHGFVAGYPTTRHSLSCSVIAQQDGQMQRDYWYSNSRLASKLDSAQHVGEKAGQRTVDRLGSRKLKTTECPVLFKADLAPSLLRHLISAIRGPALYRRASFLLDQLGEKIFPDWVTIDENPLLVQGLASAPFDNEGVATQARDIIQDGILQGYVLDSYAGRKLNMPSTANAGGVRNARIHSSGQDFDTLVNDMQQGLIVTELMGNGNNLVTGDYSRGAAGFWVEKGEIQYPVEEITVAGNLRDMFQGLVAVGTDNETPGSIDTGSWLINKMTVAGN